jgi:hypothetical protein
VLSVIPQFTDSDYPFGIFELFFFMWVQKIGKLKIGIWEQENNRA